jgi:peptidoglycan/LPS O-acetylase OafA/YrhL
VRRSLSVYLDLIRVLAAAFVFFDHSPGYTGGFLWRLSGFGHQAVMFFFVLSGFVIAYVTDIKERSGGEYAVNRLARIYSVALPALVLTIALYYLGKWIDPLAYPNLDGKLSSPGAMIFKALFFLNQSWSPTIIFSNIPYWSLGYEVLYYVFFGLAVFTKGKTRLALLLLALLLMGPSVCMALPIWLMGVGCYKAYRHWTPSVEAAAVLFAASFPCMGVYMVPSIRACLEAYSTGLIGPVAAAWLQPFAIHFFPDYLLGLAVAMNIVGFAHLSGRVTVPAFLAKGIQTLASYTFSLYLFHLPLLAFAALLLPAAKMPWANLLACMVGVPTLVILLGYLTEKRKRAYKDFLGAAYAYVQR